MFLNFFKNILGNVLNVQDFEKPNPYPGSSFNNQFIENMSLNTINSRFGGNDDVAENEGPQFDQEYWNKWQQDFQRNLQETLARSLGNIPHY